MRCRPLATASGRLDLHDQVDRAHVDAELEAARRHDRAELPRLQGVLDLEPLLARDRTVVGADQVLVGELVQLRSEPLRDASPVHEHDRRAVRADQFEQPRVDGRPDRGARRAGCGGTARRQVGGLPERGHVFDRHHDLELHRLAVSGVDDRDRPRLAATDRAHRGSARSSRADAGWRTARRAVAARRRARRAVRAKGRGALPASCRRGRGSRRRSRS